MHKQLMGPVGIGAAVVLIAIGAVLFMQHGAHMDLKGNVLKVRTLALDEQNSLLVADFRVANPADYPFVVRSCRVRMVDPKGREIEGDDVSDTDAARIFEYYPVLGGKFNNSLMMRDKLPPRSSQDRMIAVRIALPVADLDARKNLVVRIEDVDGPVVEIPEKAK